MITGRDLAVAAMVGLIAGACGSPPASKTPATDTGTTSDKNGCGNHPPGACAAASEKEGTATAPDAPTCRELARKCHPYDAASHTAHECHELGHASSNEAECQAKKTACIAACGGAAAPH